MAREGKRLEILQEARRDAYIDFLKVQAVKKLDLQQDRARFTDETSEARRRLTIYGDKVVVEALAFYWREDFEHPICCGNLTTLKHDIMVYQGMRAGIMPMEESINDADMMLLQHLCRLPDSADKVEPCQPPLSSARK